MFLNFDLERLIYVIPAIIIALVFHEYAHARIAYAFGDPTAKSAGRMTLNPLKHLDPIGTLLLIFAGFGWAKPVPVNPFYFQGNRKGKMLLVSLGGPLMNLAEAVVGALCFALIFNFAPYNGVSDYFLHFFLYFLQINVVLAVFNILPIPPLDGSKILFSLMPDDKYMLLMRYERYGMILLLFIIYTGISGSYLSNAVGFVVDRMFMLAEWTFSIALKFV